ncbi:(2Fe-2S)-binding protein [Actinomadura spongiicola]|uniref:(2Fe-2S)-binding protein n=1 Tax=Actinomadura spongiicola TaxID=2303421 RepID=A0A372GK92_9ACTN|nr:(2Fe-2S)-binding protein [Actinomadura spongiicola]RFS85806.1 (2Fe-2S)-binding protein [Actinomadura spongiicola]
MPLDVGSEEVARVLRDVARIGPYFEILTGDGVGGGGWQPFPGDPARLAALTGDYAERLGTGERRVAASLLFQGLAARLWSPVVAAASLGVVPDLGGLRWRVEPVGVGLVEPRGWRADDLAWVAERLHVMVVDGLLRPLYESMLTFVNLADGLVWGNAASALVGSLNVGPGAGVRRGLVRELLTREPLAGVGTWGPHGFVRRNCCLYYRVPGGGMCGDCGLRPGM